MIYSSIKDNWMRVELMHSLAQSYYESTHNSDFRNRMINSAAPFPFDVVQYDAMEKESCIVGMVMAWAVITLESLVNHSLAEMLNNRISAIMAIEYPKQITNQLKIAKLTKSELSKKSAILSDDDKSNRSCLALADELSEIRNQILHDKPFDFTDYGDGEVEITPYRYRGNSVENKFRYDNLNEFYSKCDKIKNYVFSIISRDDTDLDDISFVALINKNMANKKERVT